MVIVETYPDQPSHDRPEPTPMASLAQILANQANAARSTGPKTAEGKDASRRNALTHGLSAATLVLPDEESAAAAERAAAWASALKPGTPEETWLFEQIVVESLRIDRCQHHERALRTLQAARAATRWDEDRGLAAEELGARLSRSPALTGRRLTSTRQGCDWMIVRWEGLGLALDAKGDWDAAQKRLALDLLGVPAELRTGKTVADADLPAKRATIAAQVARLAGLKAEALDDLDALEQEAAELGMGPDLDREVALVRRYERACTRRMEWALTQLKKARQAARPATVVKPSMPPARPVPPPPAPAPAPTPPTTPPVAVRPTPTPFATLAHVQATPGNRKDRRALKALARRS